MHEEFVRVTDALGNTLVELRDFGGARKPVLLTNELVIVHSYREVGSPDRSSVGSFVQTVTELSIILFQLNRLSTLRVFTIAGFWFPPAPPIG